MKLRGRIAILGIAIIIGLAFSIWHANVGVAGKSYVYVKLNQSKTIGGKTYTCKAKNPMAQPSHGCTVIGSYKCCVDEEQTKQADTWDYAPTQGGYRFNCDGEACPTEGDCTAEEAEAKAL